MEARASDLPRLGPEGRFPSTPARLLDQARRRPDAPAYAVRQGAGWSHISWKGYADEARRAGRALIARGLERGQPVAILGYNRPEWTIMAHAAMMAGGAPAGVYWTSAPKEVAYIVEHSGAPVILVETPEQAEQALKLRGRIETLKHVVVMDGPGPDGATEFEAFLAEGEAEDGSDLDRRLMERLDALGEGDVGALIYTSGTTGPPKAVMLSHGALSWTAALLHRSFSVGEDGRTLSYLPIAHIAEQQSSVHNHVVGGGCLYFARSMETLAEDIQACRPTVFFGVPRVWEKMSETLQARLAEASGTRKSLAEWAMKTARTYHDARLNGGSAPPLTGLAYAAADALVLKKIRAAMGLGEAQLMISGAAPISPDVLRFFTGLGMVIYEGYGMSETAAPTSANLPGAVKLGSVGRPFPHIEARVTEEGELLVKSPGVFSGYMKNNEATEATFTRDGWLRTGDLARIDEDGFIHLTGRLKDIIITSGGKNITPSNLETALMDDPLIEHAVVIGDARPYLTALLTLSPDALKSFAAREGIEPDPEAPAVQAALQAAVDRVNVDHARVENIRKFAVLPEPLSIANGELTPTMKLRRAVVAARHAEAIERLYARG